MASNQIQSTGSFFHDGDFTASLGFFGTASMAKVAIQTKEQLVGGLGIESFVFEASTPATVSLDTSSTHFVEGVKLAVETGSFVTTGSVDGNKFTFTQGDNSTFDLVLDTGSYMVTASVSASVVSFEKGDGSTFDIEVGKVVDTGSLLETASLTANNFLRFTKGDTTQFDIDINQGFVTASSYQSSSADSNIIYFYRGDGVVDEINVADVTVTGSFFDSGSVAGTVLTINQVGGGAIVYDPNFDSISGSSFISASVAGNVITFTKGDLSTESITVDTGSAIITDTGSFYYSSSLLGTSLYFYQGDGTLETVDLPASNTSSLLITASVSDNVITFDKGDGSQFSITVDTGSLPAGLLSSSQQIETDISGAFSDTSASIAEDVAELVVVSGSVSTRVTDLEAFSSSLDANFVTEAELATATGSLVNNASAVNNVITFDKGDGTSFDVTVETGSIPSGLLSSSAQIATDISGAFTLTSASIGSDIAELVVASSSFYNSASINNTSGVITFFHGSGIDTILLPPGTTDTNVANTDLTLDANRVLNLNGNDLTFNSSLGEDFIIQSNTTGTVQITNLTSADQNTVVGISGTGQLTQTTVASIKDGTISGSAQIATDISGAFTSDSASIGSDIAELVVVSGSVSTRVTDLEAFSSSLDADFVTEAELAAATASLYESSSVVLNVITFTKGDGTTDSLTVDTGSAGLPDGVLSGSAQIATDISGAFTSTSASISSDIAELVVDSGSVSTRVTDLETFSSSLDANFVTEDELATATASLYISSSVVLNVITFDKGDGTTDSLTVDTGSAAGLPAGVLSGSAQIATDISGAFTLTSSSIASDIAELVIDSASVSTRVTDLEDFSSSLDANFVTEAELATATGSLLVSASAALNVVTFDKGDGTSFDVTIDTGSATVLPGGLLSSSAQIATDISGAFSNDSSSFSSKITSLEDFSSSIDTEYVSETEFAAATASFYVSSSVVLNTITFDKGDGTTDSITVDTGSGGGGTDTNIANTDLTLDNNRVTTLGGNNLTFDASTGENFIIQSNAASTVQITNLVSADHGQVVGISPTGRLTSMNTSSISGGGSTDTGSLLVTASAALNVITFDKGDGSTFDITVDTGSAGSSNTSSLLITASVSDVTMSFTKGDNSTFDVIIENSVSASVVATASRAVTASKVDPISALTDLQEFADDEAATIGGITLGGLYRNGNFVLIKVTNPSVDTYYLSGTFSNSNFIDMGSSLTGFLTEGNAWSFGYVTHGTLPNDGQEVTMFSTDTGAVALEQDSATTWYSYLYSNTSAGSFSGVSSEPTQTTKAYWLWSYNGTTMSIYYNGALIGTNSTDTALPATTSGNVAFGKAIQSSREPFRSTVGVSGLYFSDQALAQSINVTAAANSGDITGDSEYSKVNAFINVADNQLIDLKGNFNASVQGTLTYTAQ